MQPLLLGGIKAQYLLSLIITLVSLHIISLIADLSLAYADGAKNVAIESFVNSNDAKQQGCSIVNLKGTVQKSCVLQKFEGHELQLLIYDENSRGEFIKSQELCIPSWYQKATVKFLSLVNNVDFLFVTFEGNCGTGTLQMILMIIGWHNGKFVPVLTETLDYKLTEHTNIKELKMSYSFKNIGTPNVILQLEHKINARKESESQFIDNCMWTEQLNWNEKTFSFYNVNKEKIIIKEGFSYVHRNILNARVLIQNVDVTRLCSDFFDKTKIMYILDQAIQK